MKITSMIFLAFLTSGISMTAVTPSQIITAENVPNTGISGIVILIEPAKDIYVSEDTIHVFVHLPSPPNGIDSIPAKLELVDQNNNVVFSKSEHLDPVYLILEDQFTFKNELSGTYNIQAEYSGGHTIKQINFLNVDDEVSLIPFWVKESGVWLIENKINESDFINEIHYLIDKKIIDLWWHQPSDNLHTQIPECGDQISSQILQDVMLWIKNKTSNLELMEKFYCLPHYPN